MQFGQSSTGTSCVALDINTGAADAGCRPRRFTWLELWLGHLHMTFSCGCLVSHTTVAESQGWGSQERPGGHHVVFYDQGLEVIHHHLSCTLVIVANTKTHPWLKGRGNQFYFLMWQWQGLGRACRIKILVWPFGGNIITCNWACCLALTKVGFSKQERCGK